MTLEESTTLIEERARINLERGTTVNAFWFEEGKWKQMTASPGGVGVYRGDATSLPTCPATVEKDPVVVSTEESELGERCWDEMKTATKKDLAAGPFDTSVRPIQAVGVVAGVLVLELPSIYFERVEARFQFREYLASELTDVRFVIAETFAA